MGLLTPLGLLGLIGIPILIIIYIIKPKYHEKKISSTFIWKLSLKYRKKKIPFQWLQKSLLFFVQLLIIGLTALLLTRPLMKVSAKDGEKIVILDVSASMNAKHGDTTRFDRAMDQLLEVADSVNKENMLTVILADSTPEYLMRREQTSSYAKYLLSTVKATYEECNFDEALKLANAVMDENPASEVFFYTDCHYEKTGYVNLLNFAQNEWNVGILDFTTNRDTGYMTYNVKIGNYGKAANLKVSLDITVDGNIVKKEQTIKFAKDEVKEVIFETNDIILYQSVKVNLSYMKSANKYEKLDDSLLEDNEYFYQNLDDIKYNIQLVGPGNTFVGSALSSLKNINVTTPTYTTEIKSSGLDMYIYDSYVPSQLPTDGAIFIINPTGNIPGTTFNVGSAVSVPGTDTEVPGIYLEKAANNSEVATAIMNYVNPDFDKVSKYTTITNTTGYDVLITCNDGKPILLAGTYENANIFVLATDLHYSTLPLSYNLPLLINNMVDYSVNNIIEESVYNVGEEVTLFPEPSVLQIRFNDTLCMDASKFENRVKVQTMKPGIYNIEQKYSNKTENDKIYVRISANESNYKYTTDVLAIDKYTTVSGEVANPGGNKFDMEEATKYFAAALLALVVIEWGLQYREQY